MSEHTKGPWIVDLYGDVIANGEDVAHIIHNYGASETLANSNLISAAPELLEACIEAEHNSLDLPSAVHELLVAAIAKARGDA